MKADQIPPVINNLATSLKPPILNPGTGRHNELLRSCFTTPVAKKNPNQINDGITSKPSMQYVTTTPIWMASTDSNTKNRKNNMGLPSNATPYNSRHKDLRRSCFNTPVNNDKMNEAPTKPANQFVTPVWMKPIEEPIKLNNSNQVKSELFKAPIGIPKCNPGLKETPLDELFANGIRIETENGKVPFHCPDNPNLKRDVIIDDDLMETRDDTSDLDDQIDPTPSQQVINKEVLKNTKIYVCKKLVKQQGELFQIAGCLGAEFIWSYNDTCTHFIYSGKFTDNNKELRAAREHKKIIVSPHWLYACKEQVRRVDESLFSVTFDNSGKKPVTGASFPEFKIPDQPAKIVDNTIEIQVEF